MKLCFFSSHANALMALLLVSSNSRLFLMNLPCRVNTAHHNVDNRMPEPTAFLHVASN